MKPDPIVAEVRDRLAARFNYDIDAIVRHIRNLEAASGRTCVQPPQSSIAAMSRDECRDGYCTGRGARCG